VPLPPTSGVPWSLAACNDLAAASTPPTPVVSVDSVDSEGQSTGEYNTDNGYNTPTEGHLGLLADAFGDDIEEVQT
jgi:hypothetical protein